MDQQALTAATTIARKGDWLTAQIGEELVMMDAGTGRHIGLTETGARIWELIETPTRFGDLCTALAAEYEVGADELSVDVAAFIAELQSHGAVALS
jgi:hypothetical protein